MLTLQTSKRAIYALLFLCAFVNSAVAQTKFNEVVVVAPDGQRLTIAAPPGMTGTPTLTLPATTSTIISMSGTPNDGDVLTYSSSAGAWQSSDAAVPAGSVVNFLDNTPRAGYSLVGSFTAVSNNSWDTKASMPNTLPSPMAAAVNDKIYVFSSHDGDAVLEYNPTLDSWASKSAIPDLGGAIGGVQSCAAVDDKIYVFGTSGVSEYDPGTDTWTSKTSMPSPRDYTAAAAIDEMIYVTGGKAGTELPIVEMYNTATDTWTTKAELSEGRFLHGCASSNGKVYVFGGQQNSSGDFVSLDGVEEYDPGADTWTTKASMPTDRFSIQAVTLNSKISLVGGYTVISFIPYNLVDVAEEYDPATDTWSTKAPLSAPRAAIAGAAANGKVYAMGGFDLNANATALVEEYSPSVVLYYFVKN